MADVDETQYYWIHCKICGKYHADVMPRPYGNRWLLKADGPVECPDTPGRSANYRSDEWIQATESQIVVRARQSKPLDK